MEQYAKYLRKSRFDRDYAELSVEETLKRHDAILDKLARERGYFVSKTYYEVVSGESIAQRPMIQQLLEEVNQGLYAGVLVVDVERLARGNGADQAYISQVFQFSGTKIITPLKVYDPRNEFDEEYFEFGLFMSRREYKTITRRLARGRESSAAEGKYLGSVPPYGYRREKLKNEKGFTLSPDPLEGDTVKRIFQMFIDGLGTKKIANALNDEGTPARQGALWTPSTISHILENPVYVGLIRRGFARQVKSVREGRVEKRIVRGSADSWTLYPGLHPPLIDQDTFDRVQLIRKSRRPGPRVKQGNELKNAFAGLIFCARCGGRVARTTLSASQGGGARMRCVNMRFCKNKSADYEVVEKEIISSLREWLKGYRVNIRKDDGQEELSTYQAEAEKWRKEEEKLQDQLNAAYDLVERGIYTPDVFSRRQERLSREMEAAKQKREEREQLIRDFRGRAEARRQLLPQTASLLEDYEILTSQEKNDLLRVILRRIEYWRGEEGKIEIDLYPSLGPYAHGHHE